MKMREKTQTKGKGNNTRQTKSIGEERKGQESSLTLPIVVDVVRKRTSFLSVLPSAGVEALPEAPLDVLEEEDAAGGLAGDPAAAEEADGEPGRRS